MMATKELIPDLIAPPADHEIQPKQKKGKDDYTGDNIKILEGLAAVRLRPAMYIGSTGGAGFPSPGL